MIYSTVLLLILYFNPDSWVWNHVINIAHCQGDDDINLKKEVGEALISIKETLQHIREDGINTTVELASSTRALGDALGAAITTSSAIYARVKIAENLPSTAGKATVIAATVVATVVAKTIIQENKDKSFFKMDVDTKPSSSSNSNPHTPQIIIFPHLVYFHKRIMIFYHLLIALVQQILYTMFLIIYRIYFFKNWIYQRILWL